MIMATNPTLTSLIYAYKGKNQTPCLSVPNLTILNISGLLHLQVPKWLQQCTVHIMQIWVAILGPVECMLIESTCE